MALAYTSTPAWDASAWSLDPLTGDGEFSFSVSKSSSAVVCGLSERNLGIHYATIQFGFFVEAGKAKIVETGAIRQAIPGVWGVDDRFRIVRRQGVVRYYINDVKYYTSLTTTYSTLFADCSLYAFNDSIDNPEITSSIENNIGAVAVGLRSAGLDFKEPDAYGSAVVLIRASGVEEDAGAIGRAWVGFSAEGRSHHSPVFGSARLGVSVAGRDGEGYSAGVVPVGVNALGVSGEDAAFGYAVVPVTAEGEEYVPEVASGSVVLGIRPFGSDYKERYDGRATVYIGAIGADDDVVFGHAPVYIDADGYSIPGSSAFVPLVLDFNVSIVEQSLGGSLAAALPSLTFKIDGFSGDAAMRIRPLEFFGDGIGAIDGAYFYNRLPPLVMDAAGGGGVAADFPSLAWSATGDVENQGRGVWTTRLSLSATGVVAGFGNLAGAVGDFTLSMEGIGEARWILPALQATGEGTGYSAGDSAMVFSPLQFAAGGTGWISGAAAVALEPLVGSVAGAVASFGHLAGRLLGVRVLLLGVGAEDPFAQPSQFYVVNVRTKAVTRWVVVEAEKLATANGMLYALKEGRLLCFDGDTDDGEAISTHVRFAQSTFGVRKVKRCADITLTVRESDGITLSVIDDETRQWVYQAPANSMSPYIRSQRVKIGRGLTFHSLGISLQNRNGGKLAVGGIELPIQVISRRQL